MYRKRKNLSELFFTNEICKNVNFGSHCKLKLYNFNNWIAFWCTNSWFTSSAVGFVNAKVSLGSFGLFLEPPVLLHFIICTNSRHCTKFNSFLDPNCLVGPSFLVRFCFMNFLRFREDRFWCSKLFFLGKFRSLFCRQSIVHIVFVTVLNMSSSGSFLSNSCTAFSCYFSLVMGTFVSQKNNQ